MPSSSSSSNSSSSNWLTFVILVVALIVAVVLLVYCVPSSTPIAMAEENYVGYNKNKYKYKSVTDDPQEQDVAPPNQAVYGGGRNTIQASEPLGQNEVAYPIDNVALSASTPKDCFPKDQLTPQELLPADANSTWAQVVPAGQGSVGDSNHLTAGYHVGINTVGQTLRNANMQLRSEPPNPQMKVSPWMQSTIEPDTNRKAMEIGGC